MYSCPECEQSINQASDVCPYCGADQKPLAEAEWLVTGKPAKNKTTKRIILMCAILLAILGAVGWFAVPWKISGSKAEAESRARDAIIATQQAIHAYQASERTFPPSLESPGDAVRKAAQAAQSVRYTLQYTPGHPDADGRIDAYTLVALPGNFGYLSFYTDESGALRATREDRAATVQDPQIQQR
jgi:type II secretory pathway pseudopilin PulG/RNA polymerase subunit RPABC4/transcription elongation factor Spt4